MTIFVAGQIVLATIFFFVVFFVVVAVVQNAICQIIKTYFFAKTYPEVLHMERVAAQQRKQQAS